jgi:hypothetical protein
MAAEARRAWPRLAARHLPAAAAAVRTPAVAALRAYGAAERASPVPAPKPWLSTIFALVALVRGL